ncbi:MAG: SMC-Scp complex subunit ScpB [Gammaproteobacteria bacterium RIFCSPHIGHO2_12_FULL_41_20]|nr:MAG: SMC-Scp complex subunit ScpB [Gammaproteobacteria bacterium RIFCSPHIGHO2_12_FULL_41_20]
MTPNQLECIIEAALMVTDNPLTLAQIQKLFSEAELPTTIDIHAALHSLKQRYADRGIELREIASGFRFQAKAEFSPWLAKLWEEKPPRYSRAFLETLAIIAYQQPITRAEIESIRGVTVSSPIIKSLLEREWIRIVGYREIPGKPALYATTKEFLDYFNLKNLAELPTLAELKDLDAQFSSLQIQLALEEQTIENTRSESVEE